MAKIRARYIHLSEGVIDTLIGLMIAPVISYFFWTGLGYGILLWEQGLLTLILAVLAIVRKYIIRRNGNRIIKNIYSHD